MRDQLIGGPKGDAGEGAQASHEAQQGASPHAHHEQRVRSADNSAASQPCAPPRVTFVRARDCEVPAKTRCSASCRNDTRGESANNANIPPFSICLVHRDSCNVMPFSVCLPRPRLMHADMHTRPVQIRTCTARKQDQHPASSQGLPQRPSRNRTYTPVPGTASQTRTDSQAKETSAQTNCVHASTEEARDGTGYGSLAGAPRAMRKAVAVARPTRLSI